MRGDYQCAAIAFRCGADDKKSSAFNPDIIMKSGNIELCSGENKYAST